MAKFVQRIEQPRLRRLQCIRCWLRVESWHLIENHGPFNSRRERFRRRSSGISRLTIAESPVGDWNLAVETNATATAQIWIQPEC